MLSWKRSESEKKNDELGPALSFLVSFPFCREKEESPEEELIPVSESEVARIQLDSSDAVEPPKDPVLQQEVIHSADLGVPKDEDYEEDTQRMNESRQNVERSLTASDVKEEVEEDDAATEEAEVEAELEAEAEAEEEVEAETETEVKEEIASDTEPPILPDDPGPPSPVSSSCNSTPRRVAIHRPSSDPEDDDEGEATEGDEEDASGRESRRDDKAYRTWKKSIHMIIRAAQSHKHASVFLSPVTDDIANGYSQVSTRATGSFWDFNESRATLLP